MTTCNYLSARAFDVTFCRIGSVHLESGLVWSVWLFLLALYLVAFYPTLRFTYFPALKSSIYSLSSPSTFHSYEGLMGSGQVSSNHLRVLEIN